MNSPKPLLSIFIPTYNRQNDVCRQVEFVLHEVSCCDEGLYEIIVCDNGSTDQTIQLLQQYKDKITIIENKEHVDLVNNSYRALDYCHGEYLWLVSDAHIIEEGCVRYIFDILIKYKGGLNFLYLSYTSNSNYRDGSRDAEYKGPYGEIESAGAILVNNYMNRGDVMTFSTATVAKRIFYETTVSLLDGEKLERFGHNWFFAMSAAYSGLSYFSERSWMHNTGKISWKNIRLDASIGCLKSIALLKNVGYSINDIAKIYKQKVSISFCQGLFSQEIPFSASIKTLLFIIGLAMSYCPVHAVIVCIRTIIKVMLKKIKGVIK